MTSPFGLSQTINKAIHILEFPSSCIDLIFTTQSNLVVESSVQPSLQLNCNHQIVFAKSNLQIYYSPSYPREFWHYKHRNTDFIKRAFSNLNWDGAVLSTNINEKVSIFSNNIMNIPHET